VAAPAQRERDPLGIGRCSDAYVMKIFMPRLPVPAAWDMVGGAQRTQSVIPCAAQRAAKR